jgi:hypothetical protein
MRILVSGLIGRYAFGGVTWDYVQYVLGFRAWGTTSGILRDSATWAYDSGAQRKVHTISGGGLPIGSSSASNSILVKSQL